MSAEPFDAVVLAGGTGRRLGGASKPDVELAGRRLLDHALAAVGGARRVVVVAPDGVEVPAGVLRTLEDPPLGGPVAGIAAGLAALDGAGGQGPEDSGGTGTAPWVVILACDTPRAGSALPRLRAAAPGADGACLVDAGGGVQWLTGVYRTAALRAAVTEAPEPRAAVAGGPAGAGPGAPSASLRGRSVRSVLGRLSLRTVPAQGDEAADVDTWTDLEALARARPRPSPDDPGGAPPPRAS